MRTRPQSIQNIEDDELLRASEFITHVDKEHFDNHFVIWTANMLNGSGTHEGILQALSQKCNDLETQLSEMTALPNSQAQFDKNDFELEDQPTPV